MRLITSNEQLKALLPNIQVTVTGETPLIDKLSPFLAATEKWLSDVFTSETLFDTICQFEEKDALRAATTQAVVYEAFRRAIPHLDVILTPNGFGIVSNTNIAPASKERINRLLDALLDNRDAALSQVLALLSGHDSWLVSSQAEFFRASMFPNMEVTLRFPKAAIERGTSELGQMSERKQSRTEFNPSESRWMLYLAIREKAIVIEQFFATQYLSVELIDVLRSEAQSGQYRSMLHQKICRILQAVEIRCLQSTDPTAWMHFEHSALFDIVNTIQRNPEEFPEWHSSATAELYAPPIFENKKESKGFWF
ncbi:MAG: hypothetical protein K6G92_05305 [Bacteroidaceae bacterium]|nr:hypothetical protein [Bacteroidaceae bacterium]